MSWVDRWFPPESTITLYGHSAWWSGARCTACGKVAVAIVDWRRPGSLLPEQSRLLVGFDPGDNLLFTLKHPRDEEGACICGVGAERRLEVDWVRFTVATSTRRGTWRTLYRDRTTHRGWWVSRGTWSGVENERAPHRDGVRGAVPPESDPPVMPWLVAAYLTAE